jgi:hypothetical protein
MAALSTLAGMIYPQFGERICLVMVVVSVAGLAFGGIAARMRAGPGPSHHGEPKTGTPIEGAG